MTVSDCISRRRFLETGALAATLGLTTTVDDTEDEAAIPAPFDALPTIDEPTDMDRQYAAEQYPAVAVPETGPVPDWRHQHIVERGLVVPEWALEATREALSGRDPDDINRRRVEDFLMQYALIDERYVTADGRDAVDVLLEGSRRD
jgi:hypothetical protein